MTSLIAGAFMMIIEFAVLPEQRDEFVNITAPYAERAREFDGNIQFDVFVDPERPDVVVYVERWETREQQAAFFAWWEEEGVSDALRPMVTAAPKISAYEQAVD